MFTKYNDTPAGIALCIWTLGLIFYVVQTVFMAEFWLANREVAAGAAPVARAMGASWLGFLVGVIRTFAKGLNGQKAFFNALLIAQVAVLLVLWHGHFIAGYPAMGKDVVIVTVLTALLIFGYSRVRSQL